LPRGARPGERRGGRAKGTPNKATVEKLAIAERVLNKSRMAGKKFAKEVLEELMSVSADMAAYFQPRVGSMAPNPNQSEKKFLKYARLAVATAKALLPYQSPKLRAIVVARSPISATTARQPVFTLAVFDKPRGLGPERDNVVREELRFQADLSWALALRAMRILNSKNFSHLSRRRKL
jgi:hypothetical protein